MTLLLSLLILNVLFFSFLCSSKSFVSSSPFDSSNVSFCEVLDAVEVSSMVRPGGMLAFFYSIAYFGIPSLSKFEVRSELSLKFFEAGRLSLGS